MYLMCKDVILARVDIKTRLFEVYRNDLMPFELRGILVDLLYFRQWMLDRVLPIDRSNAKKIISCTGIDQTNRIGLCMACRGLSLTDCYWLKNENESVSWDYVSLYKNSLNSVFTKVSLTGHGISIQSNLNTPELTTDGSYAKCWKRYKDGIYLLKAGSKAKCYIEPYIEVLCSDLLDALNVNHVKYSLTTSNGLIVSKCKNISNVGFSICKMGVFKEYCERNHFDWKKWVYRLDDFYKMLIVDFLLLNVDRHDGNWGIVYSPDNDAVFGLHPLFDHNLSLSLSDDIGSKAMDGMSLIDAAKWAKSKVYLNLNEFTKLVNTKGIKNRFYKIFNGYEEYAALRERIDMYNRW